MKTIFAGLRPIAVGCSALFMAGCATGPGQANFGDQLKQTFASNDPCSNNARNIGIVGGALAGAILGNSIGGGKDESKLIGAALGGALGGLIGADMDRKRCELSKVAKQYDLEITYSNIEARGELKNVSFDGKQDPATTPAKISEAPAVIGNSVTVRDKGGAIGHFETGSDQLTPKAKEYFSAIATQYAPATIAAAQTDAKRKAEAMDQLAKRRLLLVGHTDDAGSTQLNATLSEKRAKAVAAFLKQKGIPEDTIFYQGAGESLPVADNRTEEGRAVNRRVEIVELADEAGFKKYLEIRKPNYSFYRTQQAATNEGAKELPDSKPAVAVTQSPKKNSASVAPAKTLAARSTVAASKSEVSPAAPATATQPVAAVNPGINFGGVPYNVKSAKLETGGMVQEKGFSLISKAMADDSVLVTDCSYDRPRAVGSVKSLRDGRAYKTSEHLPQLYGKTWATDVNGNLVVLNRLAVLRDGGVPANLPELKVYQDYKPNSNAKAQVNEEPAVNSYLVDKGVLYRVFPKGDGGLKCMDILFALDGSTSAKAGKLIYVGGGKSYVADFKPQLQ